MSDLSVFMRDDDAYRRALIRELERGLIDPRSGESQQGTGRGRKVDVNPSLMDDVFYALGKPEEWTAKGIGQLFSDDPAFHFGEEQDYGQQTGFSTLALEAGAPPLAAAIIGLGAAIANPLDPLNKLKIAGLTKKGIAFNKINRILEKSGKAAFKKNSQGFFEIDLSAIEKSIKEAEDTLKGATGDIATRAGRNLRERQNVLKDHTTLNEFLVAAQRDGLSLEDIRLAPTKWEQAQAGQRRLIGLSSPTSPDQLSLFGLGRGAFDTASQSALSLGTSARGLPFGREIDAFVTKHVGGALGKIGKAAKEHSLKALELITGGYFNFRSDMAARLIPQLDGIINELDAEPIEFEQRVTALYQDLQRIGYTKEDLAGLNHKYAEFVNQTRGPRPEVRAFLDSIVNKLPREPVTGKPIKEVRPEDIAGSERANDLLFTKDQIREGELPDLERAWDTAPVSAIGVRTAKFSGRFILLDNAPTQIDTSLLEGIEGVVQLRPIRGGSVLAGVRLHGRSILNPFTEAGSKGLPVDNTHLTNLELIAAQLSERGLAFGEIRPSDLIINDAGGVQIINPDVIRKVGKKRALKANRVALQEFADHYGLAVDPSKEFHHLTNMKAAQFAAKRARKLARVRRAVVWPKGKHDGLLRANAFQLLEEATNAEAHRQFVIAQMEGVEPPFLAHLKNNETSFEISNNIEQIRADIRKQVQSGHTPRLEPIILGKDEFGNLVLTNPHDRDKLAAAVMEGVQFVNVKEKTILGEQLTVDGFYLGATERLDQLFFDDPRELATFDISADPQGRVLAYNYKLTNADGTRRILEDADLGAPVFVSRVASLVSQKPRGGVDDVAAVAVARALENRVGPTAALQLAETAVETPDFRDFIRTLEQMTGLRLAPHPRVYRRVEQLFENLRAEAASTVQGFARRGLFSARGIANSDLRKLFDGTVEHFDGQRNALVLTRGNAPTSVLDDFAKSVLNEKVQAAEIVPYNKVVLEGSDGTVERMVRDYVADPHPALAKGVPPTKVLHIPEEVKKDLAKRGILVNPTAEDLKNPKYGFDGALGIPLKDISKKGEGPHFTRRHYAFFLHESGVMFLDTNQARAVDVSNLIKEVFGEGFVPAGEFGHITKNGVSVSYPVGMKRMRRLGKREIRQLNNRIRLVARKLDELGVNKGMPVMVDSPFDHLMWRAMVGKPTIGDLLKKTWSIKVEPDKIGMALDQIIDQPMEVGRVVRSRHKDKVVQDALRLIEDENDAMVRAEMEAGIPNAQWRAAYIAHIKTPEGAKAVQVLNEEMDVLAKTDAHVAKVLKPFMRQRVFTDWTADEFNEAIRRIRHAKLEGKFDPQTVIDKITQKLGEEGKLDKTKFAALSRLADAMDKVGVDLKAGFFIEDPLLATFFRKLDSIEALKAKKIEDFLAEEVGVFYGTPAELRAAKQLQSGMLPFDEELRKADEEIAELMLRRQQTVDAGEIGASDLEKIDDRLRELEATRGEALAKQLELRRTITGKFGQGINALDLDAKYAYLRAEDARALLARGLITEDDVLNSLDSGLVALPTSKVVSSIGDETKLILANREITPVLERYFGSLNGATGLTREFLDIFDRVQNIWRMWTLFSIPAYHVRNFLSNAYMAWLGKTLDVDDWGSSVRILNSMRLRATGRATFKEQTELLKSIKFTNQFGESIDGLDLWEAFIDRGGLGASFYYNEFKLARGQNTPKLAQFAANLRKLGFLESGELAGHIMADNAILRTGQRVGHGIEAQFRFSSFITKWKELGDFDEAMLEVKKIFYDYRDLNTFERSVMRRVMPFYAWSRHNIPRMIETMVTRPQVHYRFATFVRNWERGILGRPPDREEEIPSWLQNFGIVTHQDADGNWLMRDLQFIIPAYEVFAFFSRPASESFRQTLAQTTPFLKIPIEEITNYSFLTGKPIAKEGELARGFTLSSLGFTRKTTTSGPLGPLNLILNESVVNLARPAVVLGKFFDDLIDPRTYREAKPIFHGAVLDLLLGNSYVVNPSETRMILYKDWKKTVSGFKGMISWALKNNDSRAADVYRNYYYRALMEKPGGVK